MRETLVFSEEEDFHVRLVEAGADATCSTCASYLSSESSSRVEPNVRDLRCRKLNGPRTNLHELS